ncbi:RVP_2 domain-containing protein [Cephalotus follicularis]|uniref:RVP_2 domain-containing protein n=1 Tax=Cephalotus follicularis TaxID=3775 RepID=A0A1Q3CTG3_CEPFO|nr:RVP_2 domain-containing protein [Cephalotus follicularis]
MNDEGVVDGEVDGLDTDICCAEPEIDQFPEVSMLAFDGKHTPKTIRLQGLYQSHSLQVLIDNGSTHNFIQERLVSNLGISKMDIKPFHVFVGNGEVLTCSSKCLNIPNTIQGHEFHFDLYILPIQGAEVVLGIQWLELLGPVITDYKQLTMTFQWGEKQVQLQGESHFNSEPLCTRQLKRLEACDSIASLFYMKASRPATPANYDSYPAIASILHDYRDIFAEPKTLPPCRLHDHCIHLQPGSAPINVKPYHYPHFQKNEIERLVSEMLQAGIIRHIQSSFSSPVLLVKKKMVLGVSVLITGP